MAKRQAGGNRPLMFRVLAFVTVSLCAIAVQAKSAPYKWWLAPDAQTHLHLTPEQAKKLDDVFESAVSARRAQRRALDALDRQLDAMLDIAMADDQQASTLIMRLEAARARRNVARTLMFYRMRQVFTFEQRHWFDMRAQKSYLR